MATECIFIEHVERCLIVALYSVYDLIGTIIAPLSCWCILHHYSTAQGQVSS